MQHPDNFIPIDLVFQLLLRQETAETDQEKHEELPKNSFSSSSFNERRGYGGVLPSFRFLVLGVVVELLQEPWVPAGVRKGCFLQVLMVRWCCPCSELKIRKTRQEN
jgi:hypothetical protein